MKKLFSISCVIVIFTFVCIITSNAGLAATDMIYNDSSQPVALLGIEAVQDVPNSGCSNHVGKFKVDEIAYDGASRLVGGIRVIPLGSWWTELTKRQASTFIGIQIDELSNMDKSWLSTLVMKGNKLLIAYSICGMGGYYEARDIYLLDELNW